MQAAGNLTQQRAGLYAKHVLTSHEESRPTTPRQQTHSLTTMMCNPTQQRSMHFQHLLQIRIQRTQTADTV